METARQCMQRYLKLAATLRDSCAQARAQEGLGKLDEKNYSASS